MKKILLCVILVAIFAASAFSGDYEYDANDFNDLNKISGKLTDNKLAKLKKWNVSDIVIVECAGEFLQSKEVINSVFSQRNSGMITTKTSTIQLGNEYYNLVINRFYDMIKSAFEENGYKVVPKENLTSLERYTSLDLDFEKSTKGYTGSVLSDGVTKKGIKISAEGLGLFPTSPFKAIKLAGRLAELTNDAKANAAMKINFYIDKGKKGVPVLKSFNIILYGDLRGQETGFEGNKKMFYSFYVGNETIFTLKKPMVNPVDISGEEKGTVNMAKYDDALMELLTGAVNMLKTSFKED
ncbi:MAG TPA: hypothetical protein PKY81_15180 [bacterium]|nr:hypothetical protein [bacterium]HPN32292.1 hypothetical protein [bacterium]